MDAVEENAMGSRKALVRVAGIDAGYLDLIASDEFSFRYLPSYLQSPGKPLPVSLALPLSPAPYLSQTLHPFFDNLLFEGDQLRLAEKKYGLNRFSTVDRFKLLMVTGQFTLGIVSVLPIVDGTPVELSLRIPETLWETVLLPLEPAYQDACSICLQPGPLAGHRSCLRLLWGTEKSIKMEAFAVDPQNIFRTIVSGQSVSGAQRKALYHITKQGVLKRAGEPSHLLKPEGDFPEMPANEHLTMAIARQLNFRVPPIGLFHVEGIGFVYVTRRFDLDSSGRKFLAVEDTAQLSQELAENKARSEMAHVAAIIKQYASSPQIECAEFFKRVLFCFLTGNGDMHLKNWSMCRDIDKNLTKLSPIYDYLNVRASYPQEQVEMILPLNGKQSDLTRNDLEGFARKSLGLDTAFVTKAFNVLGYWVETIEEFCARSALSQARKNRYIAIVRERYARM